MEYPRAYLAPRGTVSHGTMRPQDLIPAFWSAIQTLDPECTLPEWFKSSKFKDAPVLAFEDDGHAFWGSDWGELRVVEILEELEERLNSVAPDGYYFGAHEGDGSDFGFWPCPSFDHLHDDTIKEEENL